jgi:hypothetical protein
MCRYRKTLKALIEMRRYTMNPTRMIYEDTPPFIPVPEALRHRRTEVIVWPLDDSAEPESPSSLSTAKMLTPRPVGLAIDRGVPLPDDFFAPLPDEFLAVFNGEC